MQLLWDYFFFYYVVVEKFFKRINILLLKPSWVKSVAAPLWKESEPKISLPVIEMYNSNMGLSLSSQFRCIHFFTLYKTEMENDEFCFFEFYLDLIMPHNKQILNTD